MELEILIAVVIISLVTIIWVDWRTRELMKVIVTLYEYFGLELFKGKVYGKNGEEDKYVARAVKVKQFEKAILSHLKLKIETESAKPEKWVIKKIKKQP